MIWFLCLWKLLHMRKVFFPIRFSHSSWNAPLVCSYLCHKADWIITPLLTSHEFFLSCIYRSLMVDFEALQHHKVILYPALLHLVEGHRSISAEGNSILCNDNKEGRPGQRWRELWPALRPKACRWPPACWWTRKVVDSDFSDPSELRLISEPAGSSISEEDADRKHFR